MLGLQWWNNWCYDVERKSEQDHGNWKGNAIRSFPTKSPREGCWRPIFQGCLFLGDHSACHPIFWSDARMGLARYTSSCKILGISVSTVTQCIYKHHQDVLFTRHLSPGCFLKTEEEKDASHGLREEKEWRSSRRLSWVLTLGRISSKTYGPSERSKALGSLICRERILRTKKTKCRLQIWEQIKKYISRKIPWGWLRSGRFSFTHQAENLSNSLIRVPQVAAQVNPFLMLFRGIGDDYPTCPAKGMIPADPDAHLTTPARRKALVGTQDLSHQVQNPPWVGSAVLIPANWW